MFGLAASFWLKKSNNKTANCTAVNSVVLCGTFRVYCQPVAAAHIEYFIFHLFLDILAVVPVVPRHAGGGVLVCVEAEVLQD